MVQVTKSSGLVPPTDYLSDTNADIAENLAQSLIDTARTVMIPHSDERYSLLVLATGFAMAISRLDETAAPDLQKLLALMLDHSRSHSQ